MSPKTHNEAVDTDKNLLDAGKKPAATGSTTPTGSAKKPFCVRCLIRELTDEDAQRQILAYQEQIPEHKKTAAPLYEERLSICKDCKWLVMGTCQKCGAYVEARAYAADAHCPLGAPLW